MKTAQEIVMEHALAGVEARQAFFDKHTNLVVEAAQKIALSLARGGKILLCGNGGSAADAQHVAGEFMNRMLMERPPLPAIALTTDSSILTAVSNDYSYDEIFSKQVQGLGQKGDILIAISTSGNSSNIMAAITVAREKGMCIIGLTGRDGGKMRELCDVLLNVEHPSTPVVQEVHLAIEHLLCVLTDYYLFQNGEELLALMKA